MKFERFAQYLAKRAGSSHTFMLALMLIVIWAASGPWFHYNDTWQLVINTSTTIITFLMVFVIQNTQNRDNDVLHLKIDELLRATKAAHNAMLNLDDLDARQLKSLLQEYKDIAANGDAPEQEAEKTTAGLRERPADD
ncbi:low affinity iron permease family protein [Pseudomonas auratipiscis]|uniref:Low affinity iron permease family protein n=1 Tax=Pseudomonas auratipiscis TaxID=3115853 RepID=A0AB35WMK0_9PSED|nr:MULTISPECIES: low affinity iron permease family protein [unclassified Pseudomonas]MEE1865230.1 low affinity iron permease family protein [Pseudomonas sp. 120P]MEE1955829.1 low affinity iron permease family protein [Pseudomonas sp. 119P]